jgi:DNA (cytosine-5)-methyltransferase 1
MKIRVVELFAGVGGFRLGLEGPSGSIPKGDFKVIWSNQWEPSTRIQHAAQVYVDNWNLVESENDPFVFLGDGEVFVNKNVASIDETTIPDHDLLVAGFPCQDYSVARSKVGEKGIEGKKGVMWWEIHRILAEKKPSYVILENVDRLLNSPSQQRGRDFAVMLASLGELDYVVEWRVINAADYGMPQRRKRLFILAYGPGTLQHQTLTSPDVDIMKWIEEDGVHADAFPIHSLGNQKAIPCQIRDSDSDLVDISEQFNKENQWLRSPFKKAGVMIENSYYTFDFGVKFDGKVMMLSDTLQLPSEIPIEYIIGINSITRSKGWRYVKGAKDEMRRTGDGFEYPYKEGPVAFPDALDRPSRTIITGEGGASPSRFKHVVRFTPTDNQNEQLNLNSKECNAIRKDLGLQNGEWLRRLTPVELERLNMFPEGHTEGLSPNKRAFLMGNALVVGVVEKIAHSLMQSCI